MPRLIFLFCFFLCVSTSSYSSVTIPPNIRVHLFSDRKIQEIKIQGVALELEVYKSGKVEKINLDQFNVIVEKNKVANQSRIIINSKKIDPSLNFGIDSIIVSSQGVIRAQTIGGVTRNIFGSLRLSRHESDLLLVALLSMDSYLIGVIDAELGRLDHIELWKAQAILSRTWAMRNYKKFSKEGFPFGLTDDVRSQAFHGWPMNSNRLLKLKSAVKKTSKKYVADDNKKPIEALFHANSGGQTIPSGWYFNSRYSLVAVEDSFSLNAPQTFWEKRIDKKQWLAFCFRIFDKDSLDLKFSKFILSFQQPERLESVVFGGVKKRLRIFRERFSLRSTWFSVVDSDDTYVTLKGRGYGHGIGMSQEGALKMAQSGYFADQIIKFYYPNSFIEKYE